MAEVEVIKAVEGPILRKRDYEGKPLVITRQRVAAYVRVSTDGDEQLESFQSQKQYYQDKISENRDICLPGIPFIHQHIPRRNLMPRFPVLTVKL